MATSSAADLLVSSISTVVSTTSVLLLVPSEVSASHGESSVAFITTRTMSFVMGVSEHLVFRLVVHVLHDRVGVVMMLDVEGHVDQVLLMVATTASSTAEDNKSGDNGHTDLQEGNKEQLQQIHEVEKKRHTSKTRAIAFL